MLVLITGWLGAALLLLAFFLNARQIIAADSKPYLITNLSGSLLLFCNSYIIKAWPFVVINLFWACVSIFALWKIFQSNQSSSSHE